MTHYGEIDVDQYLGIPFLNKGRDREVGLDCWGLAMVIFHDRGIELPEYNYVDALKAHQVSHVIEEQKVLYQKVGHGWFKLHPGPYNIKPPLLVLMRNHLVVVNHVAVWIGNDKLIHTTPNTGVVVVTLNKRIKSRIEGWYRPCST